MQFSKAEKEKFKFYKVNRPDKQNSIKDIK